MLVESDNREMERDTALLVWSLNRTNAPSTASIRVQSAWMLLRVLMPQIDERTAGARWTRRIKM